MPQITKAMKKILLLVVCFLLGNAASAQNVYISKKTEISFFSEARLENIEAISKKAVSAINISTKAIAFKIPIQSFIFNNGLMKEHFNENYMESDKFPEASFNGKIIDNIDLTKNGEYKISATGKLLMHGIAKDRIITGVIKVKDGEIELLSTFLVPVSAHKIDIPNDKISNISQNISVKIKAIYEPKK